MFEELDHYHHELTNFAVEAKLSFFIFPFASVTGKVDYFRQRTSTKCKKIIFYQTRRVAYSKKIYETTTQLVDDASELDGYKLADLYGTQFVDNIDYDAALQIIHTITANEEINVEKLDVGVRVTIGLCPLCVEFDDPTSH